MGTLSIHQSEAGLRDCHLAAEPCRQARARRRSRSRSRRSDREACAAAPVPPALEPAAAAKLAVAAKARATAQDFEAVFLNSMFSQMFTGLDDEGPFGGSKSTGVWRSFLTDEYAKNFAKAGGIGLGDHIYRALMAQQEARAS